MDPIVARWIFAMLESVRALLAAALAEIFYQIGRWRLEQSW